MANQNSKTTDTANSPANSNVPKQQPERENEGQQQPASNPYHDLQVERPK